jgi:CRISPR-associated protein Cas5t
MPFLQNEEFVMLCLYLQAPFGVFRTFTAGSYRPTAEFVTYSAAYGLLLNIAGIEMRVKDGKFPMTLIKKDLPKFKMAIGALDFPLQHTIFQQLHNYPVGPAAKEHAPACMGNKYNIQPIRRSFLSDIKAYICVKDNDALEQQIKSGLTGETDRQYGLPFLGDNNFLPDRLELVDDPENAHWFEPVETNSDEGIKEHTCRLTINIDRADMSKTGSKLFAPCKPTRDIPNDAWIEVGY